MSEQPGRYSRSFNGLIGAIVITLLAIGGFVAVRAFVRDDVSNEPDAVDYVETVRLAQEGGYENLVYPASLPDGWKATSVDFQPGQPPTWGVGALTDSGTFAGVRQEDASLSELLSTYLDEDDDNVTELDPTSIDSAVASEWETYEDAGGDRAYAAEVGDEYVLVYGSASTEDLEALVASLTTDPVA